jgi:hypothetical protein
MSGRVAGFGGRVLDAATKAPAHVEKSESSQC